MTYTAPSNVEQLTLTGSSNINATGNALANTLIGNSPAPTASSAAMPTTPSPAAPVPINSNSVAAMT